MKLRTRASLAARAVAAVTTGVGLLVVLGVLLAVVGGALVLGLVLRLTHPADPGMAVTAVAFLIGVLLTLGGWKAAITRTIRQRRRWLLLDTRTVEADDEPFPSVARRTASQLDRPTPELRVHPTTEPLACTTHRDGDPVLVVSEGLLSILPERELEAVVAHELAHLANGDLRLMGWAIVPLVAAEEFDDSAADESGSLLERLFVGWGSLSTGIFSRGRELVADRAAADATGDPAALAAALERLDDEIAGPPPEDLRRHVSSTDALNVLPSLDPERDGGGGPFATHPKTETRIERLRTLASELEDGDAIDR